MGARQGGLQCLQNEADLKTASGQASVLSDIKQDPDH